MNRLVLVRARDEARDMLREMIISRKLRPDTHIEEIKISEQIGLSRTPVREALIALEREGLVRSRPRKGFVVVQPDVVMVRESYPVLSALEQAALKISIESLRVATPQLRKLNNALRRERVKARQYTLDRAFHAALSDQCGNLRLLDLLRIERVRAEMIDGAHERGMANLEGSCAEHAALIDALETGDGAKAAHLLEAHWQHGADVVIKWLSSH